MRTGVQGTHTPVGCQALDTCSNNGNSSSSSSLGQRTARTCCHRLFSPTLHVSTRAPEYKTTDAARAAGKLQRGETPSQPVLHPIHPPTCFPLSISLTPSLRRLGLGVGWLLELLPAKTPVRGVKDEEGGRESDEGERREN